MQECFGLITITSRDSKVQYSSGHGGAMETLPATPTADRVTNALRAVQLMAALGASQEARGWALRDDLGISADEALERLRELEDFGLIKGYRRFLESRRDEDRWYRITPVGDFALGSHLAATRQDAHA